MTVNTRKRGETLTVMLDGALNRTTCDAVEERITSEMQGIKKLVFDMEKLSFISSAGLRVLVKLRKQVGERENMEICKTRYLENPLTGLSWIIRCTLTETYVTESV